MSRMTTIDPWFAEPHHLPNPTLVHAQSLAQSSRPARTRALQNLSSAITTTALHVCGGMLNFSVSEWEDFQRTAAANRNGANERDFSTKGSTKSLGMLAQTFGKPAVSTARHGARTLWGRLFSRTWENTLPAENSWRFMTDPVSG